MLPISTKQYYVRSFEQLVTLHNHNVDHVNNSLRAILTIYNVDYINSVLIVGNISREIWSVLIVQSMWVGVIAWHLSCPLWGPEKEKGGIPGLIQ